MNSYKMRGGSEMNQMSHKYVNFKLIMKFYI